MKDGNTPVGGALVSAEVRADRREFCRRESEDQRKDDEELLNLRTR